MLRKFAAPLVLVVAVVLAYANSLQGPLVFDDDAAIANNEAIRELSDWWGTLNPPPALVGFGRRPLVNVTMAVNYAVAGLEVPFYHATSVAFHVVAVLALFGLMRITLSAGRGIPEWLRSRSRGVALATALLWAVHPLASSAVNYLTQRAEVMMGAFFLLMLWSLGRGLAASQQGRPAAAWFAGSVAFCLLGMGSKESMLAAPLLALVYDRVFFGASWREIVVRRWGWYLLLGATALWPLWRMMVVSEDISGEVSRVDQALLPYFYTQVWGLGRMLWLVFWPDPLLFYYGTRLYGDPRFVPGQLVLLAVLLTGLVWAWFKKPALAFPALVFLLVSAPSSTFYTLTGQPVAEHRMYLPLACVLAAAVPLLAVALNRFGLPRALQAGLVGLVAVAWLWRTHLRNQDFADPVILWRQSVAGTVDNAGAHNNLGMELGKRGLNDEAVVHFRRAMELDPNLGMVYANLGNWESLQGNDEEAIRLYEKALLLVPSHRTGRLTYGLLLAKAGRTQEGLDQIRQAVGMGKHDRLPMLEGAGKQLFESGAWTASAAITMDYLELRPGDPGALNHAAWILATHPEEADRDPRRAEALAREALAASAASPVVLDTLAAALAAQGRYVEAAQIAGEAAMSARAEGRHRLADSLESHRNLYLQGKPLVSVIKAVSPVRPAAGQTSPAP